MSVYILGCFLRYARTVPLPSSGPELEGARWLKNDENSDLLDHR